MKEVEKTCPKRESQFISPLYPIAQAPAKRPKRSPLKISRPSNLQVKHRKKPWPRPFRKRLRHQI